MRGIDVDRHALAKARLMTKLLRNQERASFLAQEVFELTGTYDFGICSGGLYHLPDPEDLLRSLKDKINTSLVIQTVYSLANEADDYFESPAPHWTWGSRFSYGYLLTMVENAGWRVVRSATNELAGNDRPEDRGSAYLLCRPAKGTDGTVADGSWGQKTN